MSTNMTIKTEKDEFGSMFPSMFPQFGQSDQDSEFLDDFLPFGDMTPGEMMSLKGQVYPGMGKMDLASEIMKRTRNQRKPPSVVDKMRRTSEGIESTQVVMTLDFEVKRVKDVYDYESPAEDGDDHVSQLFFLAAPRSFGTDTLKSPPRKTTRTRRKRAQPLANLSTNVPRGSKVSASRETSTCSGQAAQPTLRPNQYMGAMMATPMGPFRQTMDVFRDEDSKSGIFWPVSYYACVPLTCEPAFDAPTVPPHLKREPRSDQIWVSQSTALANEYRYGDQFAMHSFNPMSHSNVSSPSPSVRDIPPRMAQGRDAPRARYQAHPYYGGGHLPFSELPP